MQAWTVNSEFSKDQFIENVEKMYRENHYLTFTWTVGKKRSPAQNNALHLWLGQLAHKLNEAGLDMKAVLKQETEIPWTVANAKEHLWKPIQKLMLDKDSTTEPNTVEYVKVYEVLNRHLGEKFGVYVPWPTEGKNDPLQDD